jgi:hypothetical protein
MTVTSSSCEQEGHNQQPIRVWEDPLLKLNDSYTVLNHLDDGARTPHYLMGTGNRCQLATFCLTSNPHTPTTGQQQLA